MLIIEYFPLFTIINFINMHLLTPPHEQDVTQGQFLSEVLTHLNSELFS